MATDTG